MQTLKDPKYCALLIEAYKKLDYFSKMYDIASNQIESLIRVMDLEDIKYCIERTSK